MDRQRFKHNKPSKQDWSEWLSDTPPPAAVQQELRQRRVERANSYAPRSTSASDNQPPQNVPAGVSININLPEFRRPQFKRTRALAGRSWHALRSRLTRGRLIAAAIILAVIMLSWAGQTITRHHTRGAAAADTPASAKQPTDGTATPTFTPAVPSDSPELATPDGVHSRFDPAKQNYSFFGKIDSKQFIVSEQSTASSSAAASVASQAAKQLQTSSQIKTGWGTAYIATYKQNDSQRLVLNVRNLLVFVQSSYTFSDDQWTSFLNSLQ